MHLLPFRILAYRNEKTPSECPRRNIGRVSATLRSVWRHAVSKILKNKGHRDQVQEPSDQCPSAYLRKRSAGTMENQSRPSQRQCRMTSPPSPSRHGTKRRPLRPRTTDFQPKTTLP